MNNAADIIKKLEKQLTSFDNDPKVANVGKIEKIGDEVVLASGLSHATMGEEVIFSDNSRGQVIGLDEDSVSIILLGKAKELKEGDEVRTTGNLLSIIADEKLLGRIISPLGVALDGKETITKGKPMPLEKIAAGVIERQRVKVPLKTGIKAIDALVPIGRGQRELIIGDRGLGKTALVIDTIINQKKANEGGRRVICIYVAIGQKQSTVARVMETLKDEEALEYTVIVAANAADSAALQFLAPYAGVAVAEYFCEKGEDVLIVYDDLTKHAYSYRQISLILKRPAGREAYPGDIFYLHSRLLERAIKMNDALGGGSITALPIIETQADDISAYIPTNVISITDGQIFLKNDLFNSGIRPAIDVGNSVSRVGGDAQTGAMKSVAGKIKLDLAQYRELAVFAQFGSELDAATSSQLERGKRLTEILKQPQYEPLPEELEVMSIFAVVNGFTDDIAVDRLRSFETKLHEYMTAHEKALLKEIKTGAKFTPDMTEKVKKAVAAFKKGWK